jgi:hypothetical protein
VAVDADPRQASQGFGLVAEKVMRWAEIAGGPSLVERA